MSRVHEALRRAARAGAGASSAGEPRSPVAFPDGFLALVETIPYNPKPGALILDALHPEAVPAEEFRMLRTRLNHMQSQQPIHSLVITSPSQGEGKSFAATNLAFAQAELSGNLTLLCDFDLRRPSVHRLLQTDRSPGITDYLLGFVPLHRALRKIDGTNLYIMPSGDAIVNPLELLNLKEVQEMLDQLQGMFNWILLDTPPLLHAADANLLATLCDGTVLVVRIGATTPESIASAMQSLCEDNVLGMVVNAAGRRELG